MLLNCSINVLLVQTTTKVLTKASPPPLDADDSHFWTDVSTIWFGIVLTMARIVSATPY
jgi:hypothetical protein